MTPDQAYQTTVDQHCAVAFSYDADPEARQAALLWLYWNNPDDLNGQARAQARYLSDSTNYHPYQ